MLPWVIYHIPFRLFISGQTLSMLYYLLPLFLLLWLFLLLSTSQLLAIILESYQKNAVGKSPKTCHSVISRMAHIALCFIESFWHGQYCSRRISVNSSWYWSKPLSPRRSHLHKIGANLQGLISTSLSQLFVLRISGWSSGNLTGSFYMWALYIELSW